MSGPLGFQRPLGLALAGGGAHGAWQAGVLAALREAGLEFDKVIGFSAGALTGLSYFLGRERELGEHWRDIERYRILRLRPRLWPAAFFSADPLWEVVNEEAGDEEKARRLARCDLTVVSLCRETGLPHYARFVPAGGQVWDGPLAARVVASCSIPYVWPAVTVAENGRPRSYVDGVIVGRELLRFDALAGCRDALVLQMARPEERARRPSLLPWTSLDRRARALILRQMDSGVASLQEMAPPPRVFRLWPSRALGFTMLDFKNRHCAPAYALGTADAREFLRAFVSQK